MLEHIDFGAISTVFGGIVATIAAGGRYAYNKYTSVIAALEQRPTKDEVASIIKIECDKTNLKLDHIDDRVSALHSDLSDVRDIILHEAWKTSKDRPRSTTNPYNSDTTS